MAHVSENIAKLYSKLDKFRNSEKFTDIIIVCEQKSFPCHRVVLATSCPYFESMLSLPMRDRESESIILPEMPASTFKQILEFIYTGYIEINSDNIFNLIVGSDFLNLDILENLCLSYLKEVLSFENILDILSFAHTLNKYEFIEVIRNYVIKNFKQFLWSKEFLEIPFHFLRTVLEYSKYIERSGLLSRNATIEKALIQWINHSSKERLQYLNTFIELGFEMVSLKELESMSLNSQSELPETREIDDSETQTSENNIRLNLFVDCRNESGCFCLADNRVNVLAVDENFDCSATCEFPQKLNSYHRMKCVAINDTSLFCLNYYCYQSSERFEFSVRPSGNARLQNILQSPPCVSHSYDVAEMNDSILYYDKSIQNINNIYLYNKELNTWFPIPSMIEAKEVACITVCNDTHLLYVIGGTDFTLPFISTNSFQAYDYRVNRWQQLPKSILKRSAAACCLYKGKVFVSGGVPERQDFCEVYDPVAGKWDIFEPLPEKVATHRMVPYGNALWVMGGLRDGSENLDIYKFDLVSNKWCTSWLLHRNMRQGSFKVLDAVVSKPFF